MPIEVAAELMFKDYIFFPLECQKKIALKNRN